MLPGHLKGIRAVPVPKDSTDAAADYQERIDRMEEALTQIIAEWFASGGKVSAHAIENAEEFVDGGEVDRRVNAEGV